MIKFLENINNSFTFKSSLEHTDLVASVSNNEFSVPSREIEQKKIYKFIVKKQRNNDEKALYICGQPGTGKSLTLLTISKTLPKLDFKTIYINCYTTNPNNIFSEIYKNLKNLNNTKKKENESLELIKILLNSYKRTIVLILDEIDILISKNSNLLNIIFQWPFIEGSKLLLFCISNDLDLVNRSLPRLKNLGIEVQVLQFKPYNDDQMLKIINSRLENCYNNLELTEKQRSRIFEDQALDILVKQISENNADIRKAFEVMRMLATKKYEKYILQLNDDQILNEDENKIIPIPDEYVDNDDNDGNNENQYIFTIDYVLDILSENFESNTVQNIKILPIHAQFILFSPFNLKQLNYFTLYKSYRSICEIINTNPLKKNDFGSALDAITSNSLMVMNEHADEHQRKIEIRYSKADLVMALRNRELFEVLIENLLPKDDNSDN